jgi:nitrous oxidase accessory protein
LLLWAALGLLQSLSRVEAVVHTVHESASVQQAIRSSASGDTVMLAGGDYFETVTVDVPVVIVSRSGAAIRGGYTGNVVHITAPGTVLEGVHVSEAGTRLSKDMACILIEADDVTVRDCQVSRPLHGIYVKGGSGTRIESNRIEGRLDLQEADRGNGIHLWNSRRNRVADNEILNVRDGIYFSFADSTTVTGNRIHGVRYGLHYMYSNHNAFVENAFEWNVAGAALMYSHDITFHRNTFAFCRGFRAYGVLYQSMDDTRAEGNLILDNSRGIFLNNSSNNVLSANDVVDNDLAIQLNGGCNGNEFIGNNFLSNLSDLILDVSDYDTVWHNRDGGNHWTGYRGFDLDHDGLGDRPHGIQRVFQMMETRVPEVRFLTFSPAAEILEQAERALPILNLGAAADGLPHVKPVENDGVPWDSMKAKEAGSSGLAALAYLMGGLLPLGALARWSRGFSRGRR